MNGHHGGSLPSLLLLNGFIFSRKNKKAAEDLSGMMGDGDIDLGTIPGLDVGLSTPTVGGPGLSSSSKKVDEMESSLNDLKGAVDTITNNNKTIRADVENMKGEVEQINESVKTLLGIYEAVSKEYNPFVDQGGKPKIPKKNGKMDDPAEVNIALLAKSSPVVAFADSTTPEVIIKAKPDSLDNEMIEEPLVPREPILQRPKARLVEEKFSFQEEMNMNMNMDGEEMNEDPQKDFVLMQVHKILEFQTMKILNMKRRGVKVPDSEYETLDRWIAEFKRMGGD
jgi:outer membrane murein-binding lipoprotein Lpp